MKTTTVFGDIILDIVDKGIEVKTDIPFLDEHKIFSKSEFEEAEKLYYELVAKAKEAEEKYLKRRESMEIGLTKELRQFIDQGFWKILLYGPTGTGKTHAIVSLCEKLKDDGKILDYVLFTGASGMEDVDILGKFIPTRDGLEFSVSELVKVLEKAKHGKVAIIVDEVNRIPPKTLNIFVPLLDEKSGKIRINNFVKNEIIEIPVQNVIFFFAANFGNYSGTYDLDSALLNRMDIVLEVDYQEELEDKIMSSLPPDTKQTLESTVSFLRSLFKKGLIEPLSTRDVVNMVKLLTIKNPKNRNEFYETIKPVINKIVPKTPQGYIDSDINNEIKTFITEDDD